jgi:uncharacterized membrane protein
MASHDKSGNKSETVVVYVASYPTLNDANADYAAVKQLYRDGVIGVYDAAVVSKDAAGHVKIHTTEKPTQYGALSGIAVGALLGIFFPPYLVWELVAGAAMGALVGHLWAGMSRSDLKQIGDMLQASTATLIVVGKSKLREALTNAVKHDINDLEKELTTDARAFSKDLKSAVQDFLKAA